MKKILANVLSWTLVLSFVGGVFVLFLAGCVTVDDSVHVNVENKDELTNGMFGESALVEIGDCLWYDSTTRIVYWWNGKMVGYTTATTPTPYYAPNGLPYRYNPETNTFEEIENG